MVDIMKNKTRTLKEILECMQEQEGVSDYEGGHLIADDLLIKCIDTLSTMANKKRSANKIIKSYGKVGKWHA